MEPIIVVFILAALVILVLAASSTSTCKTTHRVDSLRAQIEQSGAATRAQVDHLSDAYLDAFSLQEMHDE